MVLVSLTTLLAAMASTVFTSTVGASLATATTPGTPGTAQAGTPVFSENFANANATAAPISILSYTGSSGAGGADGETYTASTFFTPAALQCDGWILNGDSPPPSPTSGPSDQHCTDNDGVSSTVWQQAQNAAYFLGQYENQSDPLSTQALAEFTNDGGTNTGGQIQMETNDNDIPATGGHFYEVAAYFAEDSCSSSQAAETFDLLENGTAQTLSSGLDPCTAAGGKNYSGDPTDNGNNSGFTVVHLQSAAVQLSTTATPKLGLELLNTQSATAGNNVEFGLPQIVDVTPQLDMAFSPTSIRQGGTSMLTFTVTNTSDLQAKDGWNFDDALPAGLTATGDNATTCTGGTVQAPAGAGAIEVAGNLNHGQTDCTISVQVTSTTPALDTDSAADFPATLSGGAACDGGAAVSLCGLNPPSSAVLTVLPNVDVAVTTAGSYNGGATIDYQITVTNAAAPDQAADYSTASDVSVSDPLSAMFAGASWTCVPSVGAVCTGGSGTSLDDTVTIPPAGEVTFHVVASISAGSNGLLTNTAAAVPPLSLPVPGAPGGTLLVNDTNCPPAPPPPQGSLPPTGEGCQSSAATALTTLSLAAVLSSAGRFAAADQFSVALHTGDATGPVVNSTAAATTTGTGSTVTRGSGVTGVYLATPGTPYYLTETVAPGADLAHYVPAITCDDSGSPADGQTGLPKNAPFDGATGVAIAPVAGATIFCRINNERPALQVTDTVSAGTGADVTPGEVLTSVLTFRNSAGTAAAPVNYTDDLTEVLDNASLTGAPTLTEGTGLTVGHVSNGLFDIYGSVPAGGTDTVSYQVTVDAVRNVKGNHVLYNALYPTGSTPPAQCQTTNPECTTNLVAAIAVAQSTSATSVAALNQPVPFQFVVTNWGPVPLNSVNVEQYPGYNTNVEPVAVAACPSATLAPGASETCTSTSAVSADDMAAGQVVRTAVASASPGTALPAVTSLPSTVTIHVASSTANSSGGRSAGASPSPAPPADPASAGRSQLPFTGAPDWRALIGVAVLLIATGTALVRISRRRRRPGAGANAAAPAS